VPKTWQDAAIEFKNARTPFVTITLVNARGSSPQDVGARALVGAEGLLFGTVGGGKIETRAIAHAIELLKSDTKHDFKDWNLQTDIGMTCGGVVSLFFEIYRPIDTWQVAVFGAGHVAQALVPLLLTLDCDVVCIDPRAEWLDRLPKGPRLTKIQLQNMKEALATLSPGAYVTSVTMGHAFDLPILEEALKAHQFPYIGAIGSASKAVVLRRDLKERGIDDERVKSFFCPIGEDLGTNDPAEIAVSIVAQLLRIKTRGKSE
jgi:xanthine dehydrogenase accessory factor